METRILIVEDDPDIVRVVTVYLEREGFRVSVANDGRVGLREALADPPNLILLDWMLPGLDGLEFMRRLRSEAHTPVIMLTARSEESDRILGLEFGADDYVVKPFSPRELAARVKAVLRRTELPTPDARKQLGPFIIDPLKRSVSRDGLPLELTVIEFNLLLALASHPGRVFTRDELLRHVWGENFGGVDRVVDVHISNLRAKLEPQPENPVFLLTLRGVGYRFADIA